MREDAKNHYAATLAQGPRRRFTIAIVHDRISQEVYEHVGIDVAVDPRRVTAEEIVRFAHDPRTQQVAMIEGDRYEVLDITTGPDSEYVGKPFREMPIRGAVIGAIVRDGEAIFPHGDDMLLAGDRVIVFTESSRVADGRARSVSAEPSARRPVGGGVGASTSRRRSASSGRCSSTSAVAALFPAALAIGYGEPFWPFLAAGAIAATRRLRARAARTPEHERRRRSARATSSSR